MAGICVECGKATHGDNKICSTCLNDDTGNDHAQPFRRLTTQPEYARQQTERIDALTKKIRMEEAAMRKQGQDPNKH